MSLMNTAISGLKASQEALRTTGHNISNANTAGYSRQEVMMESSNALYQGFGYIGQGVDIAGVRRIYDEFLTAQLRTDTSAFNEFDVYKDNIEQIDRLIADDRTGLQPQIDRFFSGLQAGANNPAYLPSRDVALGEAQGLVDRFQTIHQFLDDHNGIINGQIGAVVGQINAIAEGIAVLNEQIVTATGNAVTEAPNDLMDARDELVRQLSELVSVDVLEIDNTYNISIGSGQSLVVKNEASRLEVAPGRFDGTQSDIKFVSNLENMYITDSLMDGGALAGLLNFRNESLSMAMNSLGQVAVAITTEMNKTQTLGIDLEGNFGNNLFKDLNDPDSARDRIKADSTNALPNDRQISVFFEDTTQITTSNYKLNLPGPEAFNYQVIRESDGKIVSEGSVTDYLPASIEFDGLKVTLEDGSFQVGDSFEIQPLRHIAKDMEMVLTRPEELAFAYPIKGSYSLSNNGTGYIDQGAMLSRDTSIFANEGSLTPPLMIRFDSEDRYSILDYSDPARPVDLEPPMNNLRFTPGVKNAMFAADPGTTQVTSWRPRMPSLPTLTAQGYPELATYNGINGERFDFAAIDPLTGKTLETNRIDTGVGVSAREIAETISRVDGVNARAITTVELSNFTNSLNPSSGIPTPWSPGNPMEFWVNGHEVTIDNLGANQNIFELGYEQIVPEEMTPNFLADRINMHYDLQALGITARSDGENLIITDADGDDITVAMRGDKPLYGYDPITGAPIFASATPPFLPPGVPAVYDPVTGLPVNIDPGDTFEISTGERWEIESVAGNTKGLLSNLTGYDFSIGGPYLYEMYMPDGRTEQIELTGTHADGASVKAEVETKLNALLDSPGRTEVSLDERGGFSYRILMKMDGTGNNDTTNQTIGGRVDIELREGVSLAATPGPGSIFAHQPIAKDIYQGFQFEVGGRPETGDVFYINWNDDGVSDNRNALDLVSLQVSDTINVGKSGVTFSEAYGMLVGRIGTTTNQIQINTDSYYAVLRATHGELDNKTGVNLDEEAARLIRFEAAYNANAQVIKVAQQLFDTLLSAFR